MTHYKPAEGKIVSIGVGAHDRGEPSDTATYDTFHRDGEVALIQRAVDRLTSYGADGLVSYKGLDFDMDFIGGRLKCLGAAVEPPEIATTPDRHVDLYVDRKRRADQSGRKWPSLEECLRSYDYPYSVTEWGGEEITNTRFGEEIGPAYLQALGDESQRAARLRDAIEHYLVTDPEANIALYHADIGEDFTPHLLRTRRSF